jgi:hypothetical protein
MNRKELNKIDERFKDTVYFIEATSNEQFHLWERYHTKVSNYEQYETGKSYKIGSYYGNPINLCFSWVKISDKLICFYECISEVCHHGMIEQFIKDTKIPSCNSTNFHICINSVFPNGIPYMPVVYDDIHELILKAKRLSMYNLVQSAIYQHLLGISKIIHLKSN